MDLINIGKFIAELRKETGLTQEQLGKKIGVTNKTVSRWETGVYLPPADALLALGELFNVSVNEILSGKRLNDTEYKAVAEENLAQVIKASSFLLKDKIGNYSVTLRNPQFQDKVENWKGTEKNQRNVNIQEAKKVVC